MAPYRPNRSQQLEWDPYVCEYGLKREFWVLGAVLAIYSAALFFNAAEYRNKTEEKKEESNTRPPSPPPSPRGLDGQSTYAGVRLIQTYLTSTWRRGVAIAVHLAILGAQLLEGYWILATFGRLLAKLFIQWWGLVRAARWAGAFVLALSVAVISMVAATLAFAGLIMSGTQLGCILELCGWTR
jgi:hypothetical protein